jgi:hypothetical protein
MKRSACVGSSATSTCGLWAMCTTPSTASTRNHSTVTGPKKRPMPPVPKRCAANSAVSTSSDSGTMKRCSPGAATSRPSIAPSTDTAGVMTPSPKKIAVPKMPSSSRRRSFGRCFTACEASASIAIRPPSPLLSARRISTTYLKDTTTVSVQNTSDRMPRMFSGDSGTRPCANTSFSAYSGLVPMSP